MAALSWYGRSLNPSIGFGTAGSIRSMKISLVRVRPAFPTGRVGWRSAAR
jgi:hypothetical protein